MTRFVTALIVTLAFAVAGWAARGVTLSGAAAGFVVAFAMFYCMGPAAFGVLFAVFVLTWIATRIGYARKQQLGIAERRRGRRNAGQVLANIGVGGVCAVVAYLLRSEVAVIAAMASLAEAAADTVSSECGEAWSGNAYLITGFRAVPVGTDGAISAIGTLAGACGAAAIGALSVVARVTSSRGAALVTVAGFAGMIFDSVLGATVERRGWFNNNAVNFSSTAAAAALALVIGFAL